MKRILTVSIFTIILVLMIHWLDSKRNPNLDITNQKTSIDFISQGLLKKHNRIAASTKKYNNPDEFFKYHSGIRQRENLDTNGYPLSYKFSELNKARRNQKYLGRKSLRIQGLDFIERGPSNVPGRTRAILVMPDDPEKHWLAGAVGGGIWETKDAGKSWEHKTNDMPSLAISCMAISESNPNVIYAGTGEGFSNIDALDGAGIFKSLDGGSTWEKLVSTNSEYFKAITRIIVDPKKPDIILATTTTGRWSYGGKSNIMKSIDGGLSWRNILQNNGPFSQILYNSKNFNTMFAAIGDASVSGVNGLIYKSIDGGENWFIADKGISSVYGRIEIAMAPSDTTVLYASVEGNVSNSGADLYVSHDTGESWMLIDQEYRGNKMINFLDGIGWYANTIAVNPYNADEVFYGGVNLWKTIVGESTKLHNRNVANITISLEDKSVWFLISFGGNLYNGRLQLNEELKSKSIPDVQIITGDGISQKAHRFTVNLMGSGVQDEGYLYQDYVDVPFQVWDISNNKQLMVSFRDQQEDAEFNLIHQNTEEANSGSHSREYVFIHNLEYNESPHDSIAQNGGINKGHTYKQLYFYWPVLEDKLEWDEVKTQSDTFTIDYEYVKSTIIEGSMTNVSDAYYNYDSINSIFYQSFPNFFHPDHHDLIMIPLDEEIKQFKILNANDGGVYVSKKGDSPGITNGDWIFSGYGYNSGQFYGAAKKPGVEEYIGGMQDNGTWKSSSNEIADASSVYKSMVGGDGFDVIWHSKDPAKIIASSQYNDFYRTINGGNTWTDATSGLNGVKPFLSKLSNSNSNPNVLFTVTSYGVMKSENFGETWGETFFSPKYWDFSNYTRIKVSLSNYEIVWTGSGMNENAFIYVSTDNGETFEATNNYSLKEMGSLSGFTTHPYEDSTAYALFSYPKNPKILRTQDLGETWEDISGFGDQGTSSNGFPDVAVYSLLVRPDDPSIIWAGTEIGIFESVDNGENWYYLENDMGAASVWDMSVMDDKVVLATHGRGIFTATMDKPFEVTFRPEIIGAGMSIDGTFKVKARLTSVYDSSAILINGQNVHLVVGSEVEIVTFSFNPTSQLDSAVIQVVSYRGGKSFKSDTFVSTIFLVMDPLDTYVNNFEGTEDDFAGYGFEIMEYDNFDDKAIHSIHPYWDWNLFPDKDASYFLYLKHPLIIDDRKPLFYFDNLALIERDREKSQVNTNLDVNDYVVIEGSADGINWLPLLEKYDANYFSAWETAHINGVAGDQSLMKTMNFDMRDIFSPGDTILIRFGLYAKLAKPYSPLNWGWAIDNLQIQSVITLIENQRTSKFNIFPNPATNFVHITLPGGRSFEKLVVYQASGQIVKQTSINHTDDFLDLNVSDLKPGFYVLKISGGKEELKSKLIIQ